VIPGNYGMFTGKMAGKMGNDLFVRLGTAIRER
jgi:hypothetical protein